MNNASDIRRSIRDWIVKANGRIQPSDVDDATPILKQRLISSVQVIDLLVYLELIGASEIDVERLRPASFKSVNSIYRTFFSGQRR